MESLTLPPTAGSMEPRRDGDRYWLGSADLRGGGWALVVLALVLLAVPVAARFEPTRPGDGFTWPELVAGVLLLVVPLAAGGLALALRTPYDALLDVAAGRVHRLHGRTGEPVESRATDELWLCVVPPQPDGDSLHDGPVSIVACGPEPHPGAAFHARLWTCAADEPSEKIEQCLAALRTALPWRGVVRDPDGGAGIHLSARGGGHALPRPSSSGSPPSSAGG